MSQAITNVLVREGVISEEQLFEAEKLVDVRGEPVLTVLIEQGAIARRDVVRYLLLRGGGAGSATVPVRHGEGRASPSEPRRNQ